MNRITVRNTSKAVTIGSQIDLADTFSARLVGLLGRKQLSSGRGLLIEPSSGVHTIGMAFAIDVVALDKHRRVVKTWPHLPPYRLTGLSLRTHSCLELEDGQIEKCSIEAGDQLEISLNTSRSSPKKWAEFLGGAMTQGWHGQPAQARSGSSAAAGGPGFRLDASGAMRERQAGRNWLPLPAARFAGPVLAALALAGVARHFVEVPAMLIPGILVSAMTITLSGLL